MDTPANVFLLIAVLLMAIGGIVYLVFFAKTGAKLNVSQYQTKWLEIENSLARDNDMSYQHAIVSADKLLDQALKERHFKGQTMGDRMKSAGKVWRNANHVWSAHKIRNQLVHETNAHVSYEVALRSLSAYKQALKDLGAI